MATSGAGKPRQIKAWPDLRGLIPLLKSQDKFARSKSSRVHIDLSQVHNIDAVGAAIFLARLSQLRAVSLNPASTVTNPDSDYARSRIAHLEFEERLTELGFELSNHRSLFDYFPDAENLRPPPFQPHTHADEALITVIPTAARARENLISDAKRRIKAFLQKDSERSFAHEQLMIILLEMVKNTLDHSGKPAIIGLRFEKNGTQGGRFCFCYCDTGDGIGKAIRRLVQDVLENSETTSNLVFGSDRAQVVRLMQKGGFSDILHWALQPGNSTKSGNGINLGLGLMLIVEGARNCGVRLSLKDADSMWLLTELHAPYSHAEIRRLATNTCADPLLVYHGEMEFTHDKN